VSVLLKSAPFIPKVLSLEQLETENNWPIQLHLKNGLAVFATLPSIMPLLVRVDYTINCLYITQKVYFYFLHCDSFWQLEWLVTISCFWQLTSLVIAFSRTLVTQPTQPGYAVSESSLMLWFMIVTGGRVRCDTESTRCTDDHADSVESAASIECTVADSNVQRAVPEPSNLSRDLLMSSDVDSQQSTIGQFLLLDQLFVDFL